MAQAKKMLSKLKSFQEGGEVEADPFPTIRESLAELGANPDKYEKILAKTDETLHWEKVFRPKTTLEAGAITLLAAAKQSGAEPNEYLSRLAPYFDSRIQSLPDLYNVSGYVRGDAPDRAVMTRTARETKGAAYTLPHELEHTLQGMDAENFLPLYGPLGTDTKRFGAYDRNKDRLQQALSKIPVEEREQITAKHPIFGDYLSQGNELFARIRAKDMVDSAKGEDFLQTDLGQKLFPTDRDRAYFIGSTLPGVPTATPPYAFESTEKNKKPLTDPKTSYARQLYNKLVAPKEYQEGGEVIGERTPYDSELKFFKENPNVGGMMAEDEDAIVMNPYSSLTKQELDAVRLNERARVLMRREGAPSFELTQKQQKMLSSMPFYKEATPEEQKATIAARVLSGDPSAGEPTEEQLQFVKSLRQKLDNMSGSKKMLNELRGYQEGGEVEMPEEQASPVTEAAKQMLFYKKTAAPRVVPDTMQADGMYQEPTVASETARIYGMQPREDRGSILPIYKSSTGLVAPGWMYDIARNATAADMARKGYAVAPEEAVNMALNVMGGGLGVSTAMRKPTGGGAGKDLGMFVGQKSNTWDMDKLESALDFEKAGIDPAEINRLTGYWKNPSSKVWSQEISDHTASLIPGGLPNTLKDSAPITDVLSHTPLFDAYPDLKNVIVKRESGVGAEGAKFDPAINTLFIGEKVTNPKTQLSYMIHELQHWVQTKENFPRGTSPEEIAKIETPEMAKINERLGQLFYVEKRTPKNEKEFTALMAQLKKLKQIQADNSFALYNRVEGEAQARNTQERMWMDDPTRRGLTPLGNFDVPVSELIQMGEYGKLSPTSRVPGAPVKLD